MSRGPSTSYVGRFSGWTYASARALGHVEWTPRGDDVALAEAVQQVYADHDGARFGPLGPRGCAYVLEGRTIGGRLVVKGTEAGSAEALRAHFGGPVFTFADVGEVVGMLRRSRVVGWHEVDDGRTMDLSPQVADDARVFLRGVLAATGPDVLADQDVTAEVWCEATGGLGFWSAVAHPWGVPVHSGSGMIPTTAAQSLAASVAAERGRPRLVIIVTDHDPAGYVIADRLAAEADAFLADYGHAGAVSWQRLAVTEAQVDRFGLRWGGPKSSHGRRMARTVEAEALTATHPDAAVALLDAALSSWLDLDRLAESRALWTPHAAEVAARLA